MLCLGGAASVRALGRPEAADAPTPQAGASTTSPKNIVRRGAHCIRESTSLKRVDDRALRACAATIARCVRIFSLSALASLNIWREVTRVYA